MSRTIQIAAKSVADRVIAVLLCVVLLPIFAVIAVLIRLDSRGPIFFRQQRLGRQAKPFTIWKFRSMVENADDLLDDRGRVAGARRVTRVGAVLRSTSLDELPQTLNILRGEMSFIGPRPTLPEHYPRYSEAQRGRFEMKPGITGLAQVSGRNTLPWSARIDLDLEYIAKYSWWLDMKILIRTAKVVFLREGVVLDRNPEQVDDLGQVRQDKSPAGTPSQLEEHR